MSAEKIIDALDAVTWYNGLAKEIIEWKKLPKDDDVIACPDIKDSQLQVIWMICCILFGDYGTSPRTGWIYTENVGEFHKFIDAITFTERSK